MSVKEQLCVFTKKKISELAKKRDTSTGRAMLANLRRGIGKEPGEIPETWGILFCELPEELLGKNGTPSRAEWAAYIALTMYALHQQGSAENVNTEDVSLGKAAAKLMKENTDAEYKRVLRRFGRVITAKDMAELSHHLRGMIQLFKAEGIRLDYVRLAKDIYYFQSPENRKKVQLSCELTPKS